MSMTLAQEQIKALALDLSKVVKTPEGLSALNAQLTKITVEASLGA